MVIEKGKEGFYLGSKGEPQDTDFFCEDEPANPKGFNREMWKWGLENGYPEDGLTRLYGPKPNDLWCGRLDPRGDTSQVESFGDLECFRHRC